MRNSNFIDLYEKLITGAEWINKKIMAGKNVKRDKRDFEVTEERVDKVWLSFTRKQQDSIMVELVEKGYWPKEVMQFIEVFDGRITSVTKEPITL